MTFGSCAFYNEVLLSMWLFTRLLWLNMWVLLFIFPLFHFPLQWARRCMGCPGQVKSFVNKELWHLLSEMLIYTAVVILITVISTTFLCCNIHVNLAQISDMSSSFSGFVLSGFILDDQIVLSMQSPWQNYSSIFGMLRTLVKMTPSVTRF